MSEWRESTLTTLGSFERGRSRHRPRNDPALFGDAMPFFQTGDVKAAVLHMTGASDYYSELGVSQSRVWEPGIACITIAANIAETAVLGEPACFPDSIVGFTPCESEVDSYYVKYLLDFHRARLTSAARGTTQDNLSLEKLLAHRFMIPDAHTRQRIVSVLRSVDELIENNLRRIEVLEEMAQAIYRERFVHFRYPSHEETVFVDSPLGPIPEDWAALPLEKIADLTMGQSPRSEFYNDLGNGSPFHQGVKDFGPHFPTHRIFCTVAGRDAGEGDVLISVRAPVGRLNIAPTDMTIGRGLAAARSRDDHQSLLFYALKLSAFSDEDSMGSGTIFKAITKKDLHGLVIPWPPPQLADQAEATLAPMVGQIRTLSDAATTLSGIRDLLLPKLVTGEVDVSELDLDALVEAAS